MQRFLSWLVLASLLTLAPAALASGDIITLVSLTTAPLIGHPAGLFSLDVQLNDGAGTGDGNNTVVLSNFDFGNGGGAVGGPLLAGGATGSVSGTVRIVDTDFLNQFMQVFTPGSVLAFQLALSTNVDSGGTPDQFSIALLDSTGAEIPTLGFLTVGSDVLLLSNIDAATPMLLTFASDTTRLPAAGGGPIDIAAPQLSLPPSTAVPEPATWLLLASGLISMLAAGWRRSKRTAAAVIPVHNP
jgi:hypothetical protein